MTILQLRLKTCIQTILEYESALLRPQGRNIFSSDLNLLRDFLGRIEQMDLSEADVMRLEEATVCFLNELQQVAWSSRTDRRIQ